jgi:hypothetical protein
MPQYGTHYEPFLAILLPRQRRERGKPALAKMWMINSINYVRRGVGRGEEVVALAAVDLVLEARRLVPDDRVDSVVVAAVYDGTLLTLFSCTLNLPLPHISYAYSPNNVEGAFSEVYIQHSA